MAQAGGIAKQAGGSIQAVGGAVMEKRRQGSGTDVVVEKQASNACQLAVLVLSRV